MEKCSWALQSPQMQDYHDKRWGRACHDERLLFEYLVLEMDASGSFVGYCPEKTGRL